MSVLDRPDDDNNDDTNKDKVVPSLFSKDISSLSIEKQFTHTKFRKQIQGMNAEQAIQMLDELHILYLGTQETFVKWAKQDLLDTFK
jgi:hypothetical protein